MELQKKTRGENWSSEDKVNTMQRELDYTKMPESSRPDEENKFNDFGEDPYYQDDSFWEQAQRVYQRHEEPIQLFLVLIKLVILLALMGFSYYSVTSFQQFIPPPNATEAQPQQKAKEFEDY